MEEWREGGSETGRQRCMYGRMCVCMYVWMDEWMEIGRDGWRKTNSPCSRAAFLRNFLCSSTCFLLMYTPPPPPSPSPSAPSPPILPFPAGPTTAIRQKVPISTSTPDDVALASQRRPSYARAKASAVARLGILTRQHRVSLLPSSRRCL
jgi:hypothetical protein